MESEEAKTIGSADLCPKCGADLTKPGAVLMFDEVTLRYPARVVRDKKGFAGILSRRSQEEWISSEKGATHCSSCDAELDGFDYFDWDTEAEVLAG